MALIITHRSCDIDNVLSCLALMLLRKEWRDARVEFVDANWNGEIPEDAMVLDMDAGGRGLKGLRDPDGTVHSCFAQIVAHFGTKDDQKALAGLVRIVDAHDAHGSAFGYFCPDLDPELAEAVENTSIIGVFRALKGSVGGGPNGDYNMLDAMGPIFEGVLKNGRIRVQAEHLIAAGKQVHISPSGKVALTDNVRNHRVNDILFKQYGVRAVVYVEGFNLGVYRKNFEEVRMDDESLRAVVADAGELEEWFAHTSGFLFCRGSSKAPARTSSKVDPWALAKALDRLFA